MPLFLAETPNSVAWLTSGSSFNLISRGNYIVISARWVLDGFDKEATATQQPVSSEVGSLNFLLSSRAGVLMQLDFMAQSDDEREAVAGRGPGWWSFIF